MSHIQGGMKLSVYKGDFLGFQLGDKHSYNLNITRVSSNDRYTDILTPSFTDATTQVPGGTGTYYWDSNYTQRQFQIDFAFDELTDNNMKELKQMLGVKEIQPLIFDEHKDRKYMVKIAQPPSINYIGFKIEPDNEEGVSPNKIYKGEGTVQFIAYYPFGLGTTPVVITSGSNTENVGELPAYPIFTYTAAAATTTRTMQCVQGNQTIGQLQFKNLSIQSGDSYIQVNCRTQLIEGLDASKNRTGTLYNQYISLGDFFTIPVGTSIVTCTGAQSATYEPVYY